MTDKIAQVFLSITDKLPMSCKNIIFYLSLFIVSQSVGHNTQAFLITEEELKMDPDKVYRKPAVIEETSVEDEELLKEGMNQNLKSLRKSHKVVQEVGIIGPECADCESLTSKKKGRSPALEIKP